MIDLRSALGDDIFEVFMHEIALGRYSLLLGAGASAGSVDQHGKTMPVGHALRDEIAEIFELGDAGNKSLKRVYGLAATGLDPQGRSISAFIKDRFTKTQPAAWLDDLLRIQWDSMWTLNVDDTIERAHFRLGAAARQKLTSVSWTDRHYQADRRLDELVLVHLHGKAARAQKENELIFDISGYTTSLQEQHRWLKIFGDDYPAKPFVIIGASIDEEIDLQDIFTAGKVSLPGSPSLIVLKDIDAFQRAEYEKYGLRPVQATGEEFIHAVRTALPEFLNKLTDDEVGITEATPSEGIRFLSQWKRLALTPAPRKPNGHDLYLGHEPKWYDATNAYISRRPAVKRIFDSLLQLEKLNRSGAIIVYGEAFNGKTSVLLRSAHEAAQLGLRPWIFDGDSVLDVEAVLYWIQREPRAVLIVDNASDFARDLHAVLTEARDRKLAAKIVLVERSRRIQHVQDIFLGEETIEVRVAPRLADGEMDSLVTTLEDKRRLGVLTNMASAERKEFFRTHDSKLFSIMAALEDGRGFKQRVSDELAKTSSSTQKNLLAAVSLASRLGYSLPFEVMRTSANIAPAKAQDLAERELSDLLEVSRAGLGTRHRIFAELLILDLPLDERQAAIVRLALAVAPHVSPQAIREGTLYYRIARGIMGTDILQELLGSESARVLKVYEDLKEAYDWNARFWEQRSLAAADANLFEPAFSWAQQAVKRRRDALSLTTTGKVLMLRAVMEAQSGHWPTSTFEAAERTLNEARQLEGSSAEYPIETFLNYTAKLVDLVPNRDAALDSQIRALWGNWYAAILGLEERSQMRLSRIRKESASAWDRIWPGSAVRL